jgi:hypothetical protein
LQYGGWGVGDATRKGAKLTTTGAKKRMAAKIRADHVIARPTKGSNFAVPCHFGQRRL